MSNYNPAGNPRVKHKERPDPPGREVLEKMGKEHTERDFLRDLDKATRQKPEPPDAI